MTIKKIFLKTKINKKIKKLLEPNMRLYFVLLVIFVIVTFFFGEKYEQLAVIEGIVVVLLFVYSAFTRQKRRREILNYIESITSSVGSAADDTLHNFPMPMAIFTLEEKKILSANENFLKVTGDREHFFEMKITDVVPEFSDKWLMEGKTECPDIIPVGDRKFRVYGSIVRAEKEPGVKTFVASTYWLDVTEYARISDEYSLSRPVFTIIMMDNYEEFLKGMSDKDKSAVLSMIDDRISTWAGDCGGYLCKYDRDRYIFVFEERHLQKFVDGKFSLLDSVREISNPRGVHATVSIGIGKEGKTFSEAYQYAALGIEMALSRGGDQAVIKNRYNFEFFGGRSSEMEKRTKVKSRVMANSLGELISESSSVFIMGHKYADLDTIGAAVGICCAARKKNKEAYIVFDEDHNSSKALVSRMSRSRNMRMYSSPLRMRS